MSLEPCRDHILDRLGFDRRWLKRRLALLNPLDDIARLFAGLLDCHLSGAADFDPALFVPRIAKDDIECAQSRRHYPNSVHG